MRTYKKIGHHTRLKENKQKFGQLEGNFFCCVRACVPLRALIETFSNTFFGQYREPRTSGNRVNLSLPSRLHAFYGSSFSFKTTFLRLVIFDNGSFIARDQSDLPFDYVNHVAISVCYLFRLIGNSF